MRYSVTSTPRFKRDANEIYAWLEKKSPSGARRWWAEMVKTLQDLKLQADSHSEAPEAELFDEDLRQALFKTRMGRMYRIIFMIRDSIVHALAVRAPGQDLLHPGDINFPE